MFEGELEFRPEAIGRGETMRLESRVRCNSTEPEGLYAFDFPEVV